MRHAFNIINHTNILVLRCSILELIKFCFRDSQMFHQQRIFSQKKLLCKVSIFFIDRLANMKAYQKNKKKNRGCHLKKLLKTSLLGDDKLST
jgi:hypothetical protein